MPGSCSIARVAPGVGRGLGSCVIGRCEMADERCMTASSDPPCCNTLPDANPRSTVRPNSMPELTRKHEGVDTFSDLITDIQCHKCCLCGRTFDHIVPASSPAVSAATCHIIWAQWRSGRRNHGLQPSAAGDGGHSAAAAREGLPKAPPLQQVRQPLHATQCRRRCRSRDSL